MSERRRVTERDQVQNFNKDKTELPLLYIVPLPILE